MSTAQAVKIGIAEMEVVIAPNVIRTCGLGSCVGVVIYDAGKAVAGMAHVMLPHSSMARGGVINAAKYADTAVEALVQLVMAAGGRKGMLKAKLAGGAQMFSFSTAGGDMMRIGARNVEEVKKQLERFHIPVVAEDVGGHSGRTIEFNPQTGVLSIRTAAQETKEI
ncbi:chemotaxis protein CheD [Geobacillus sp. TFV-3]|uniref:chemotaxis protein CheD n=1 Tax=Geobacillus sp. TFV-3 TaxID=1897059 RepID=UPI001357F90B|nr:chemotaxis protein CheD [Geobacillus sp. TFV-3]KAF0995644.1 Chemoreceptor glutamine deamidase CheD [Geobacillus sp. TFV-3]